MQANLEAITTDQEVSLWDSFEKRTKQIGGKRELFLKKNHSFIVQQILIEHLLFGKNCVNSCGCNTDQIPALVEFIV